MKAILSLIALGFLGYALWHLTPALAPTDIAQAGARGLLDNNATLTGMILVDGRGLDLIALVAALLLSAVGVRFALRRGAPAPRAARCPRAWAKIGARMLVAPALLTLVAVLNGAELSLGAPLGGVALIAAAALLLKLYKDGRLPSPARAWLGALSPLGPVIGAFIGLIALRTFIAPDVAGVSGWAEALMRGGLPILYTLIGLKVGADLSALFTAPGDEAASDQKGARA